MVVDFDAGRTRNGGAGAADGAHRAWPPVIAVTQSFDANVARTLLQMRIADFLVKPVAPIDLVRACARVGKAPGGGAEPTEAQIFTFLPAVGGAGVTTLAIQTAMLMLNSGGPRGKPSTCLVDLNFQHGAVADYLDLEPRLNLAEIEPRPDRLDRQLLEVMLSYHASGLAVIAAPNRPADMRSFDPDVVTRLLDLVSTNFDYVVFDMPRTWFSWTDSVLLGSNKLYIVSEITVPGLRHAKQLVAAIKERLGEGPHRRSSLTVSNSACSRPGLRRSDVEQRSATLSPRASPTATRWCAKRSTAACRSTRSTRQQNHRAAQEADAGARRRQNGGGRQGRGADEEIQVFRRAIAPGPEKSAAVFGTDHAQTKGLSDGRPLHSSTRCSAGTARDRKPGAAPRARTWPRCRKCRRNRRRRCSRKRPAIRCSAKNCSTPRCVCTAG